MNMGKEKGHSNYSSSPSFWDVALKLAAFGLVGFYLALSSVTYILWSLFLIHLLVQFYILGKGNIIVILLYKKSFKYQLIKL